MPRNPASQTMREYAAVLSTNARETPIEWGSIRTSAQERVRALSSRPTPRTTSDTSMEQGIPDLPEEEEIEEVTDPLPAQTKVRMKSSSLNHEDVEDLRRHRYWIIYPRRRGRGYRYDMSPFVQEGIPQSSGQGSLSHTKLMKHFDINPDMWPTRYITLSDTLTFRDLRNLHRAAKVITTSIRQKPRASQRTPKEEEALNVFTEITRSIRGMRHSFIPSNTMRESLRVQLRQLYGSRIQLCSLCRSILIKHKRFSAPLYPDGREFACPTCIESGQYRLEEVSGLWANQMDLQTFWQRNVRNYNYNVLDRIPIQTHKKDKGSYQGNVRLLGIELEVTLSSSKVPIDINRRVEKALPFAILKGDSSISGRGFEIVSAPASIHFHQERWEKFFDGPAKYLRGDTEPSTGLHVHLDREAISLLTLGKMLEFFSDDRNVNLLNSIAGRSILSGAYHGKDQRKVSDVVKRSQRGRYVNLNLRRDRTAEFRMFRSTVLQPVFLMRLEFCDLLPFFCTEVGLKDLHADIFQDFLSKQENRSLYSHLAKHLGVA